MRFLLPILVQLVAIPVAAAQSDPRAAQLALLLAAEDRRVYDPALFAAAMAGPDPFVRHFATLGAGRIQDRRAGAPILALLELPDTTAHATAMFALGLLGDSTLASAIVTRLEDPRPLADGAVVEAPAALAKLGTAEVRAYFGNLLTGTGAEVSAERRRLMLPGLLLEGWRFGPQAPVREALGHLNDPSAAVRGRAAYLLGRTRAAAGTRALLAAASDADSWVRQSAMRGLTRAATDSAALPRDSVLPVLGRGLEDPDAGVRVNALVSLATWADSALAPRVMPLLADPIPNVRFQAVTALGALRGAAALDRLAALAALPQEALVIRREALLGLLRTDTALVVRHAERLAGLAEPRDRALSLELAAATRTRNSGPFAPLLRDADPAVRAQAMGTLGALDSVLETEILSAAQLLRNDSMPQLRSAAWGALGRRSTTPAMIQELVAGWHQELARGRRGVPGPILAALRRAYESGGEVRQAVEEQFLANTTPPNDYLMRRSAANWPALAERWGAVFPAEVRYDDSDYRAIAQSFLLDAHLLTPRVRLVTEGRGVVEIEMLGLEAPLTVTNFLTLVEGRFFDGGEWHRVIPNFVVQDGAGPRGRVAPGPPPIRDEFNSVRYDQPVLGMALSGPDTGTSQWFINLSPQPHLDGGYTVFGRVVSGVAVLERILQGDRIISITRH